ncbi:uncharacterized protein METZ01_LOCUS77940 [marine metagenome]|uniref:Nicotinamide nucleotide repair protein n=1 Tax=marine metagenome TaxID=408172 RepID=A0A381UA39_9ZZZZ
MKIVTSSEMADIEERSADCGVSINVLLDNAGQRVASEIESEFGPIFGARILALIGPGNNGSDGLVACTRLVKHGAKVTAAILTTRPELDGRLRQAVSSGVDVLEVSESSKGVSALGEIVASSHVVIDAVLGTGASRPILNPISSYLKTVKKCMKDSTFIAAVDLPSGVNANTGSVDESVIVPQLTVVLGYLKIGHLTQPGAAACGVLKIVDIGIPEGLHSHIDVNVITAGHAASLVPRRLVDSNKGTFGRTMVVGGSENYSGAPGLAGAAAARAGAGLVTLAVPQSITYTANRLVPEATLLPLYDVDGEILDGWSSARLIYESLYRYSALLVGCGLGMSRQTRILIDCLILSNMHLPPLVIDADGLNIISKFYKWWDRLPEQSILTPHVGEMSRLTGLSVKQIQSDRLGVVKTYSKEWRKVVVLKGANTLVGEPNGSVWISGVANPALASAGTGDVLSGIISGFASQGLGLADSAVLGVYVHGAAGGVISERTGPSGLLASDLLLELPNVVSFLRKNL